MNEREKIEQAVKCKMEGFASNRSKQHPRQSQRTGHETLKLLLDDIEEEEPGQRLILYLQDGLKGAENNWTKYPNDIHGIMAKHLNDTASSTLYLYLWWCSWGKGKNYTRISYATIIQETTIGSLKTAQRASERLIENKFIVRILLESGQADVNKQGSIYRIMTPEEIKSGKTAEEIPLSSIPTEGVLGVYGKYDQSKFDYSKNDYGKSDQSKNDHTTMVNMTRVNMTRVDTKPHYNSIPDDYGKNDYGKFDHPFKEEDLKDSLSQDLIDLFYRGLGQDKISDRKRERARAILSELEEEGYTNEQIEFAIQWTVKNKRGIYDFAIIAETISEALAVFEKSQSSERLQQEQEKLEKHEREEENKIVSLKENMSETQRRKLREDAIQKIHDNPDIKQDFVTEQTISGMENQIIRQNMM